MSFKDVKNAWKIGIIFYIIALIAYIVGFATPHWYSLDGVVFGLFQLCNFPYCYDSDNLPALNGGLSESTLWTPSQAVLGIGMAALVIGGILVVVAAAVGQSVLSLVGGFLVIIGGIFGLAGGLFFMIKPADAIANVSSYTVSYSSIILLLGSIAEMVSGILLLAGRPSPGSVGP